MNETKIVEQFSNKLSEHLSISGTRVLSGGLRCETKEHNVSCKVIAKKGSYSEFHKQKEYLEQLPDPLRSLFSKVLLVDGHDEDGLMVLELIEGTSLHDLMFDSTIDANKKRDTFSLVFSQLESFSCHPCASPPISRDLNALIATLRERFKKLDLNTSKKSELNSTLDELSNSKIQKEVVRSSYLHGDAQAGNIIVTFSDSHKIRFIDPLGGSGQSPGDWVYDWSRLYHWIDVAGIAYESEKHDDLKFNIRINSFFEIQKSISLELHAKIEAIAKVFGDMNFDFWFNLYSSFHYSGKLNNFRSSLAQELLLEAIFKNLRSAIARTK
jgi:aminoglycoside phosphotransferase